jgi:hypothetical protein
MTGSLIRTAWNQRHSRLVALSGWGEAQTFADVGELTAQWLLGEIPAHPGYYGGPDEETVELIPTLARANRAGYVTHQSGAAFDGINYDGARAQQRAFVEGLVADDGVAARLTAAAEAAGLLVSVHPRARWRTRYDSAAPSARLQDQSGTWSVIGFTGATLSRRDIALVFDGCSRQTVETMCRAWQVTIADPEWGHGGRLWLLLDAFAATPRRS